jgi:hypothetical protein
MPPSGKRSLRGNREEDMNAGHRLIRGLFTASFASCLLLPQAGCEKKVTGHSDDGPVNVSFPVGRKCVYASAAYADRVDSTGLLWLKIFSIQFDSTRASGDSLFYMGHVLRTQTPPVGPAAGFARSPAGRFSADTDSGGILVSVDRKWILFQNCDIQDGYDPFLKSGHRLRADADTMSVPTEFFGQSPVYPRKPRPYGRYDAVRPSGENYSSLRRTFDFEGFRTWTGPFGSWRGLFFSVRHTLFETTAIDMIGIMDSHGIVASQYASQMIRTAPDNPAGIDTLTFYHLNRRLVDFSDPATVKPLSWYADRVMREGLEPLEQPEESP